MEWVRADGFVISDDRERIDIPLVHHWLSEESYWAVGTSLDRVAASIRGSITLGCFNSDDDQVGVTRLVTDGATFGLLTDVFVEANSRGRGLGKWLVGSALEHPEAKGLNRMLLATDDAHGLYRLFGFTPLSNPERWMEWRSSFV
jgi:GNAT superfamily N-acetyltransferase